MDSAGAVWAWGCNSSGQLGDGTRTNRNHPLAIDRNVSVIFENQYLKTDGSLWAMGDNVAGQLGDGTTTPRSTPVPVATGDQQGAWVRRIRP